MTNENKIKITSRILRIFIFMGLISIPIMNISFWIMNSSSILALPDFVLKFIPCNVRTQIPLLSEMSFSIKVIVSLSHIVSVAIPMLCLAFLAQLFKYYQNLEVFSKGAIRCIRNIGLTILIGGFLDVLLFGPLFLFLPDSFPVSNHLLNGAFFGSIGYSLRIAAEALGIILISWIMKMGYEIQEEQKHTV